VDKNVKRFSHRILAVLVVSTCLAQTILGQVTDEEKSREKKTTIPKAIDFSQLFGQGRATRDDFETFKRQKELKLKERMSQPEAIEKEVDPRTYIVGPGDEFSFNIWGAMEVQYPITVNPEGKLLVPSVGELSVSGRLLNDVQRDVLEKAKPFYEKCTITLSLESVRFFRIHVVGEVKYPGSYVARAMSRISEMITEAGGVTDWAWKRQIELRHTDCTIDTFDMDLYEQTGSLERDLFVNGGDVVYVPPIDTNDGFVIVEGDFNASGSYQISTNENIIDFLRQIRALNRNVDFSKVKIVRKTKPDIKTNNNSLNLSIFCADTLNQGFFLKNGDRILLSSNFVYVKGSVLAPGAYPYVMNLRAKDYAGMAGGDYRSGNLKSLKTYHVLSGKTEKGLDVIVEPGDIIHLNQNLDERLRNYFTIISVISSLIIAAKAAGMLGK
jgi:protein involved in polysaccharide export with SLBB domain